ncbi:SymE family type I addiction module toxin [Ferruginibacter sp. HRS2-29]|uniref:SymE family type I addiction module toxin n=1 Tax=Ferruginibacter sp. HRS2-29 TaxID=2487334 RepID=UPI0034E94C77|nr:type I addiction module toxin, SymE family [Ferruginibacter sp. HRS2-29]
MRATKKKANTPRRPDVRSIKISTLTRINEWSETTVPYIRLSGNWLQNLGFNPHDRITVTTMTGLLIIRAEGHGDMEINSPLRISRPAPFILSGAR